MNAICLNYAIKDLLYALTLCSQQYHSFLADRTIGRAFGTLCRLSSVRRLSVTFCIVAKRCVLAKNCLKE